MKTIAFLAVSLVACGTAYATPVEFVGAVQSDFQVGLETNSGTTLLPYTDFTATRYVDVLIDASSQTSYYNSLGYSFPSAVTDTATENVQVSGGFQIIPVTVAVTINPVSISKSDLGPYPLTQGTVDNTEFIEPSISADSHTYNVLFNPFTVTGSYTITGPSQTASGTFSESVTPFAVSGYGFHFALFPNSISEQRFNNSTFFTGSTTPIYSGTINGAPVDVEIGSVSFDAQNLSFSTINAVPEPSTLALLLSGGFLVLMSARKRAFMIQSS